MTKYRVPLSPKIYGWWAISVSTFLESSAPDTFSTGRCSINHFSFRLSGLMSPVYATGKTAEW